MSRIGSLRILLPGAVVLFLLTAIAISVVGGVIERRQARLNELQADSLREISLLAELAEEMLAANPDLLANSVARLATNPQITAAAVIDEGGNVVYSTAKRWNRQPAAQLPGFSTAQYQQAHQGRAAVLNSQADGRQLVAMMSFATPSHADELRSLGRGVAFIQYDQSTALAAVQAAAWSERLPEVVLLLLIAALLGWLVQRMVAYPIQRMQQAAQAIAAGDFGHRLDVRGPSEIRGLAQAFNEMTRKLAESVARLTGQAHTLQTMLQQQQQMQQERDRLISVLEATTDLVGIADPQGRVLYLNQAGRRMTGLGAQELGSLHFTQLHPAWASELLVLQALPTAIQSGSWSGETALCSADGREIPTSQVIVSHLDSAGQLQYLSTVMRDITESKRAEQLIHDLNAELEQRVAQRTSELETALQELESFSYSVSHDLRSPLRGLDGYSQVLLEDYGDRLDDAGRTYLQRIRAGTQTMGHLIDDLLNLARVSRAAMQHKSVDLSAMAQDIVQGLRDGAPERSVEVVLAQGLYCQGDPGLLHILMANLLENAWKYTSKTSYACITFEAMSKEGETIYCVRDNGAGFDMQYVNKLFRPFQRLHRDEQFHGTGIGLATVARIVQRHGGAVWAEGDLGKGARFYFTLNGSL